MIAWSVPASLPPLVAGELHCWAASIAVCAPNIDAWRALLSDEEQVRCAALQQVRDRDRFVVTHAIMRLLLAHYAHTPPSALGFSVGAHGKPALAAPDRALNFNLSHSGDLVLIAVADVPVGVDVEAWAMDTSDHELGDMAGVAFSPLERETMRSAAEHDLRRVFFDTWTRKEAYIKATGDGVSGGLDHFDVSAVQGDAHLLADRHDAHAPARWTMRALDVAPGYSAALAWASGPAERARDVRVMQFVPVLAG